MPTASQARTRQAATEAPAKVTAQTKAEAAEDKAKRMALAAARRDRAESEAYHLAAQGTDGAYLPDGGSWDAIGLARLASAGLASALKAYRTANLGPEAWQDIHGALVVAALAKVAEAPETCQAPECQAPATWATPGPGLDYLTCQGHRPGLTKVVHLPERETCGKAYREAKVTEDADGNVTVTEVTVTPRVKAPAETKVVALGRTLHKAPSGPAVARVNLAWAIERAKGMLADYWADPTTRPSGAPWDAEAAEAWAELHRAKVSPEEAKAEETWASALTWADLAPHLAAEAPAERLALALALTDGLEREEAGNKATEYGYKAPIGAEAAKKAAQRAYKALAERLAPEDVRAAILTALGETETAEAKAPESVATLAPATMANRRVPLAEARAGLAEVVSPGALRRIILARVAGLTEARVPTPGLASHRVGLTPGIVTLHRPAKGACGPCGPRALVLAPVWQVGAQAAERAKASAHWTAEHKAERAKALARAAKALADPVAWAEAWHLRADYLAREAERAEAEALPGSDLPAQARAKARRAQAEAIRATTCRVSARPRTLAPHWTEAEAADYLATLPEHKALTLTERAWPEATPERAEAYRVLALAWATERAATLAAETKAQAEALPGRDLPEPWRMEGPSGPMQARTLTTAEAKAQQAAKAKAEAERETWPLAERMAWQHRAEAQVKRAKRRAERAAKVA